MKKAVFINLTSHSLRTEDVEFIARNISAETGGIVNQNGVGYLAVQAVQNFSVITTSENCAAMLEGHPAAMVSFVVLHSAIEPKPVRYLLMIGRIIPREADCYECDVKFSEDGKISSANFSQLVTSTGIENTETEEEPEDQNIPKFWLDPEVDPSMAFDPIMFNCPYCKSPMAFWTDGTFDCGECNHEFEVSAVVDDHGNLERLKFTDSDGEIENNS